MLRRGFFDHVNPDGQDPSDRARAAGYPVGAGENIAWYGDPGFLERDAEVYRRHEALFLSPHHRTNLMNAGYRELGNGVIYGTYERLNSIMVTENFGNRGGDLFITGVAYSDQVVADNFYTIGESLGAITITATRNRDGEVFTTTTGRSGGYGLQVPTGVYTVSATGAGLPRVMTVADVVVLGLNTKVDFNARVAGVGSIAGLVFEDLDADGVRDANEPPVAGRTVYLDAGDDGSIQPDETRVTSDAQGRFVFANLRAGSYVLRQVVPPGWDDTLPNEHVTVTLVAGQDRSGLTLGSILVNAVPVARPDAYITDSGLTVMMDLFANDEDPDGEIVPESTRILVNPQHGEVGLNPNERKLVYTANKDYVGADFFEYAAVDNGGLESNPVRVDLTVNPPAGTAWQNPVQALDANNDSFVSSIDALLILDSINANGSRRLRYPTSATAPPPYLDVSGDAFVTPLDALLVLNEINRIAEERRQANQAEGEEPTLRVPVARPPSDIALLAAAVDPMWGEFATLDLAKRRL